MHPTFDGMADAQIQTSAAAAEAEALFRPAKRRKFYRRRNDDEDSTEQDTVVRQLSQAPDTAELVGDLRSTDDGLEDNAQHIGEILRLRKLARARKGGIAFNESVDHLRSGSGTPIEETSAALVLKDEIPDEIKSVTGRFAPQTGQVVDVDKHM